MTRAERPARKDEYRREEGKQGVGLAAGGKDGIEWLKAACCLATTGRS